MTKQDQNADNSGAGDERDQKLLTITEAAGILRTPVATLRYWRHLGTGPRSFRLGRHVFYKYTDLIGWVDEQRGHEGPHAA